MRPLQPAAVDGRRTGPQLHLFARDWDARRSLLRGGGSDEELARLIRDAVSAKKEQHGNDAGRLAASEVGMYQIGG